MITRREMIQRTALTAGAISLGGPLVLTQEACKESTSLAKWTGLVSDILTEMSPILGEMGASGIVGLVAKALPVLASLKKAFQDNANSTALELFNSLTNPQTGIIVEIASALNVLQGSKRVILLGLMASAQVILRTIAANIESAASRARTAAVAANPVATRSMIKAAEGAALEQVFAASKF